MTKLNYCISANKRCNSGKDVEGQHVSTKVNQNHLIVRNMMSLLLMIVMLVGGNGFAWGQTSYGKAEINSAPTINTGWHCITDQGNVKAWYTDVSNEGYPQVDNKYFVKLASNGFIKIRVQKGTVAAGDILRVEVLHFYNNTDKSDLGFLVEGSNSVVQKQNVTDRNIYSLDYILKAADIKVDTDNPEYDYIQINRNGQYGFSGCAYHSVEILRQSRYTITWDNSSIPTGCDAWFTIVGDAKEYRATKTDVPAGTNVTFHGIDSDNDSKMINGWSNPGGDYWGWGATKTVTVNSDISVKPDFQDCILLKLTTSPAEGGTAAVTVNGNDANGKKFFQSVKPTFTASVNTASGYTFDGWYDGSTKMSSDLTYNGEFSGGAMVKNIVAKFKAPSTANTISKPGCGGVYMDQSKLNAGTATLTVSGGKGTVTTGASGGYISVKFDQAYSFTNLKKYTVSGTNVAANLNNVEFLKDGVGIPNANFYSGCSDKDLTDQNKNSVLTSVDEIRFHFKANTTTTIDYIYFEVDHGPRTKPTLANPTAAEMKIFTDETLPLRITNTAGFWREYTNDQYNTETFTHIGHDANDKAEYKPSYDISGLGVGDYYFGIKDGGYCSENNKYHESGLVKVHVKVIDPIASVDVNGTKRYYDVYAPNGISGNVGVVISLHGASNDYDNGRVDFNGIADNKKNTDKRFVVVYPRGLIRQLRGTERGWETYTESNTEDVEFFKAIVEKLKETYAVDMNRIYLAGFSNGGMMAYKAAHQAGDFFAAFASVGGFPVNESHLFHAGVQPTPFMHIQGKADNIFPSKTYPLDVIVHNLMYRNGASFTPAGNGNGAIAQNSNVEEDCHQAVEGGAAYYMYKVANMGHTWTWDWTGDGQDDVAPAMWAFFNKDGIAKNVDKTLKFRINSSNTFWDVASTGKTGGVNVGYIGFDNVNSGKSVLSYGGYSKIDNGDTYNKDTNNKNLWHSLQFQGGTNGAAHFLKLNVETDDVGGADHEVATDYFLVKLTKTGSSTPVFAKRYQAGRGTKDLYINFSALPGFNEYKLEITKSRADLSVKIHDVEFHTGKCQDFKIGEENGKPIYADENPVFFFDVADMLDKANMKPIYQPIIGKSFDGIAKEYLPIADIPVNGSTIIGGLKVNKVDVTNISSTMVTTWDRENKATIAEAKLFNLALTNKSGEDVDHKSNNAYLYVPANVSYTVDKVKGINISANGRAEMPEYLNGTRSDFPDRGVIAIKVQGTVDFFLLASSKHTTDENRRTLKVYYTNDQMSNELKELKEWWFYGTRNEENNGSLPPLSVNVRLPQLGQDGTCTLFITYEGNGKGQSFTHVDSDNDEIWIKGFVIKRPDLKVTIGRTDSKYVDKRYGPAADESKQENNTKLTHFGENKPYIWNFENVGFNNTKKDNLEEKKFNMMDGRTYVCGNNTNENGDLTDMDHLLLYNNASSTNVLDKIHFDGRVAGQEHIEFCKASEYSISEKPGAERKNFDPIQSNGLKVNVTGSGWFKIKCSAPNGPVKVKVYSSTNYGASYINLLREFEVNTKGMSNAETNWQECTVYLKGHVNRTGNAGFWDGDYANTYDEGAEEIIRMSLFVVFDEMTGTTYDEGHPQFNIHELSWLNETPADYVFQREEDPKLLTTWQNIKRVYEQPDGTKKEETLLWWKAANDDDLRETIDGKKVDTYDVIGQFTRSISDGKGVKSPGSYASTSVPSDAGAYNAYWDIAAPAKTNAHTEAAYANGGHAFDGDHEYINKSNRQNTEFDMPVSGSFVRICAMKNTYVVAHVLPGAENAAVYVLDETGAQIPFAAGTDDAKRFGYIATMINANNDLSGGKASINGAIRVDFTANAGKEYFICAKGASISLARLEVHDWRYKPTKSSNVLALADGANNSATITEAYNTKDFYRDATLTRTFKKDTWASLVLPFSLNEKKFEEVFGEGAQCLHFTDVDTKKNVTTLTHHYYNMIVAGRPVFIRPTKEVTNPSFADITLQAATIRNTTTTGFDFVASYDNATIVKNDLYLNNSNAIQYYAKAISTYPGMRSFIRNNCNYDFSSGTSENSSPAKTMFLNFYDVDSSYATGIEELITGELSENTVVVTKSTKVYDLNGRAVAEGANISNLPAGIYIVNGKKFVVR